VQAWEGLAVAGRRRRQEMASELPLVGALAVFLNKSFDFHGVVLAFLKAALWRVSAVGRVLLVRGVGQAGCASAWSTPAEPVVAAQNFSLASVE